MAVTKALLGLPLLGLASVALHAAESGSERTYSPYADRSARVAESVYWGDTHLHTSYSTDAGMIGNKLGPEQAYRFALGEVVETSTGQRARINRPLDFLVISDHAANLGLAPMIAESNPELLQTEWGKKFYDLVQDGKGYDAFLTWGTEGLAKNTDLINSPEMMRTVWDRQIAAAEKFNDPGRFTALIGYEWTSINTAERPSNLHRVVVFKDGADKVSQVLPFSTFDSHDPEKLWEYLANYEQKTGGKVLAIPHNGNLSNGLMFSVERLNGEPIDLAYAQARSRWEPLYEVTQIKGDGEAHALLSPDDEFADYGTWDKADIAGFQAKEDEMLPFEYARSALQVGLQQRQKLGVNPFKFGMIGSTDSHTSLVSTREENYFGKMASGEPSADRYKHYVIRSLTGDESLSTFEYETLASGLAAVWASDNTRQALFDAMQRKETYATTGTRITVRFFGGWKYEQNDAFRPDAVDIGYARGVPMGGDLSHPGGAEAPTFMVSAMKDPDGANLDRLQIVKGWIDADGERRERVYDVACAGRGVNTSKGSCKGAIDSTVDETAASYLNTVGAAQLSTVWRDPDFDAKLDAVYYARVLEIPTPTWQAHDANFFGTEMPKGVPLSHQERAYTSPIWYTAR